MKAVAGIAAGGFDELSAAEQSKTCRPFGEKHLLLLEPPAARAFNRKVRFDRKDNVPRLEKKRSDGELWDDVGSRVGTATVDSEMVFIRTGRGQGAASSAGDGEASPCSRSERSERRLSGCEAGADADKGDRAAVDGDVWEQFDRDEGCERDDTRKVHWPAVKWAAVGRGKTRV